MWPFKKKEPIISRFKQGDIINFRHHGELSMGWVYNIYKDKEGQILYDIQIGGQCPAVVYAIPEEQLKPHTL